MQLVLPISTALDPEFVAVRDEELIASAHN